MQQQTDLERVVAMTPEEQAQVSAGIERQKRHAKERGLYPVEGSAAQG